MSEVPLYNLSGDAVCGRDVALLLVQGGQGGAPREQKMLKGHLPRVI